MVEAIEQAGDNRDADVDFEHEVTKAVARLKAGILSVILGLIAGVGLFAMTAVLLLEAGSDVNATTGFHLNLLGNYFPGFSVSWKGACIGFGYGFLIGAVIGGAIGYVYNRIVVFRGR
jgi:hypothetical protein